MRVAYAAVGTGLLFECVQLLLILSCAFPGLFDVVPHVSQVVLSDVSTLALLAMALIPLLIGVLQMELGQFLFHPAS